MGLPVGLDVGLWVEVGVVLVSVIGLVGLRLSMNV